MSHCQIATAAFNLAEYTLDTGHYALCTMHTMHWTLCKPQPIPPGTIANLGAKLVKNWTDMQSCTHADAGEIFRSSQSIP